MICNTEPTTVSGEYNDSMLTFNVFMVNDGDMTIDATENDMTYSDGSDASDLIGIEILFPDGSTLITDGDTDPANPDVYPDDYLILGIEDVDSGVYVGFAFNFMLNTFQLLLVTEMVPKND